MADVPDPITITICVGRTADTAQPAGFRMHSATVEGHPPLWHASLRGATHSIPSSNPTASRHLAADDVGEHAPEDGHEEAGDGEGGGQQARQPPHHLLADLRRRARAALRGARLLLRRELLLLKVAHLPPTDSGGVRSVCGGGRHTVRGCYRELRCSRGRRREASVLCSSAGAYHVDGQGEGSCEHQPLGKVDEPAQAAGKARQRPGWRAAMELPQQPRVNHARQRV